MNPLFRGYWVETAIKFNSIHKAVLFKNIVYWVGEHRAAGTHFHDGKYWYYISSQHLSNYFPEFTKRMIDYHLNGLLKLGVIIKGNYNALKYDRTRWFALADEEYWLGIINKGVPALSPNDQNVSPSDETVMPSDHQIVPPSTQIVPSSTQIVTASTQIVTPIPYTTPIELHKNLKNMSGKKEPDVSDNGYSEGINKIIIHLNTVTNQKYRPSTPKTRDIIRARLKEGFTVADFIVVIDKMHKIWTEPGERAKMEMYLRPETLFGTKFESYLNRPEKYDEPNPWLDELEVKNV